MNPATNSEPIVPSLAINVSAEEAERLLGKWLVVDDAGDLKVVGDDFEHARQLSVAAGLDFAQVEFVCIPPAGDHRLKFQYLGLGGGPPRPYLRVSLAGPKGMFRQNMLVDSGADFTMPPMTLFRSLGIQATGKLPLAGVGGAVVGSVGMVSFKSAAGDWSGQVVGAEMIGQFPPVLGHVEFFQRFDVFLSTSGGWFSLEPHS